MQAIWKELLDLWFSRKIAKMIIWNIPLSIDALNEMLKKFVENFLDVIPGNFMVEHWLTLSKNYESDYIFRGIIPKEIDGSSQNKLEEGNWRKALFKKSVGTSRGFLYDFL